MKKLVLPIALLCTLGFVSCSNDNDSTDNTPATIEATKQAITEDFGNNVAMPAYTDLKASATDLNSKIQAVVTTPTDAGLEEAKTAWRNMRVVWEQSEGFLFGPVEDNEYDPKTDTWPTDYAQMDSLLGSTNTFSEAEIENLDYTLRGYHPIEYMLWGKGSNKTAASLTAREKQYLAALSTDLQTLCGQLYDEWSGGYLSKVTTAGRGSTSFGTYQSFFTQLNNGMIDICNEVGKSDEGEEGKIYEPFIKNDSNLVESPYSENSMIDFKNNITGAYNVYIGNYKSSQKNGLSNLVQLYNKDLDNRIKIKFQAAISSFDGVTVSFEKAIFDQRTQLQNVMTAIGEVREILNTELATFIITNVKN